MSQAKLSLVLEWKAAADALQLAKADEADKKAKAVKACFPDLDDGLNKIELPRGYVFKATHYPNYSLAQDKASGLIAAMKKKIGALLAARLFKISIDVRPGEYKKLPDDAKSAFDGALTISPATPKLELVEPA